MLHRMTGLGVVLVVLGTAVSAAAERLRLEEVPEPLRPWVEWVLHDHENAVCAPLYAQPETRQCAWPSRLTLALDEHGGTFTQHWEVQRALWVPMPGEPKHWPQEVTVDGAATVVVDHSGVPRALLQPGQHAIAGRFTWDRLPEILPIPSATALLELSLRGAAVPFPERDAQGRLWLQRQAPAAGEDDRIDVEVHRLVQDGVPLRLVSRIQLDVAGKGREVTLGPVLPGDFVPMALESPLPARLEGDGRLRLQVRAGRWMLELRARHSGPAASLTAPRAEPPWDANEVWAFEAQPALRVVDIEGADSIDPQQTDLPDAWRQFPTYLMRTGAALKLIERRRGDADPAPDQLGLERTLWLDFDGAGYTVRDHISGTLVRSARLDMAPPTRLGRVSIGGVDQFITRLDDAAPPGVEIRTARVDLEADSRLDGVGGDLPAVSWRHDFQTLSATLQLPPGWRLLHARGVDEAAPTWIGTWTLLDLFGVLLIALATARLYDWRWGALALVAVGLSFTEIEAPRWIWLVALAAEALGRLVSAGRLASFIRVAHLAGLAVLVILAVAFALAQVRQGFYPALQPMVPLGRVTGGTISIGMVPRPEAAPPPAAREAAMERTRFRREDKSAEAEGGISAYSSRGQSLQAYVDPRAVVQTGPGLPTWNWHRVSLQWSGPVERDQRVHLLLVPPWANLLLALARTLLLAALVVRLVRRWKASPVTSAAAALGVAVVASLFGAAPARADFPSSELLDALRSRLLEPPDCHPICAAFPRLHLEVGGDAVRMRLQADVSAASALPLPGQAQHWLPRTVLVDGRAAAALWQDGDGTVWLNLPPGRHDVVLEGPLPGRDTVQIPLPLPPRSVEARVSGWTLDGLHENGVADAILQLTRIAPATGEGTAPLQPSQLPPFASVERTLQLALTWAVETRVVRLTPPGSALVLEIPLLAGEAVTTADVRVVDGKALINLPAQATETTWQSTLSETSPIRLQAPEAVPWVETWRLDAGPVWHVESSGIPPVHGESSAQARRDWRPWPGETLALDITRPQGVGGQTLTIDRSEMRVSPGVRTTEVTLELSLRSSRGGRHALTLPEGAVLQSVKIDAVEQPIRQEGRSVVLPVAPGAQRIDLRWLRHEGIAALLRTPVVDLGAASVNVFLNVAIPANRWVLLTGGPRLGPAVLFWTSLLVVLLIALGLGRVRSTPLRARHWFLLGIGLTQVDVALAVLVAGWLLALGWRRERGSQLGGPAFDVTQILLVLWTAAALWVLFSAIQRGLLGTPDMQIAGAGSTASLLQWYADRAAATLPQAWVLSAPLFVYRLAMLLWALWIALALLRWLRWAWECFGSGGYWTELRRPKPGSTAA